MSAEREGRATEEPRRCRWCGRRLDERQGPGRQRAYCAQACRQRDYIARLRVREAGLAETELIVARSELDELYDALYVLEAAVQDVDRDLAASDAPGQPPADEVRAALDWLLDAARPLVERRFLER